MEKKRPYEKLSIEELAKLYKTTKQTFSKASKEFKAVVAEIKLRLSKKEITQEKAAELFGVDQSTISRWVNPPKRKEKKKDVVTYTIEDARRFLAEHGYEINLKSEAEAMRRKFEEEKERIYKQGFLAGLQVGQQLKMGVTNIPINPTT
jgi:predicted transcriptional regulator